MTHRGTAALLLGSTLLFNACKKDDDDIVVVKPDVTFYGITDNNQLLTFNAQTPEASSASVTIAGLQAGEQLLGIDFRPATGQLYGIGNTSRLYVINPETGVARALGTAAFTPALNGTIVGFDFNPTVDRIRLVTDRGQNLRLHPETGAVAATDADLNPGTPAVTAAAYNNNVAGAATTTLFDLDSGTDKLYRQDPPNNGTLVEIGALGVDAEAANGFDISGTKGVAYAVLTVGEKTKLYTINLQTGAATGVADFPVSVLAMAVGLGF
ncbi:MAG: DUF4394 domain-containing protein [Ferruginibacter sp.]|nr:DUF4394 domain-containing protein [Cytophagales bacterium]